VPVLVIIPLSFNSGTFWSIRYRAFLQWYHDLFTPADWMRSLKTS
jgi:ABC-type spermidine/putrescine transport system permease subunit II